MPDAVFRSYVKVYPTSTYIRDFSHEIGTNRAWRVRYYWTDDSIDRVKSFYDQNPDNSTDWMTLYPQDNFLGNLLKCRSEPCYFDEFGLRLVDVEDQKLSSLPFSGKVWTNPDWLMLSQPISGGTIIIYNYVVPH
ncbi:MAG: hypothetical protein HZC41_25395 [Chloroflexi bacterium]|nr:hypothetical protein [Chloroflexota bacterium]